jgi:putative ABC transport system permease protein
MTVLRRKMGRDIRKEKARYFAVAFLVFLGLLVYASTWFAYKGLDQSYRRTSEDLKYNDIFVRTAPAPRSSVDEVAGLEGVETVLGRLALDTGGRMPDGAEIKVHLIGLPAGEQPPVNSLYMENGSYFEPGAAEQCIAESHLAEYYGLLPGDRITVFTPAGETGLEVQGAGASSEYFMVSSDGSEYIATPRNYGVVFVPEGWLQGAMGMPDTVNEYCILTSEGSDQETVLAGVQAVLAPYIVVYAALGSDQPAREMLDIDVKTFKELSQFFPFLFLVVAAFSLYMVITRLVFSQRKTVGTMMSYGMDTKKIALHYLSYSAMIWIAGSFAGIAAGYFLAREMTRMYAETLGIPLVTAGMDWGAAALGCGVTLVICLVAGCIPLVRLLKETPARVLKGENGGAETSRHSRRSLDKLLPFLKRLSLTTTLPLRNLGRNRRRTIFNAVTFTFAVALILVSFAGLDSMNYVIDFHYQKYINYDAEVAFAEPATMQQVEGLTSIGGVEKAEARTQLPARFMKGEEVLGQGLLDALPAGEELLRLYDAQGNLQELPQDGALVSSGFGDFLDVHEGDLLAVESPLGIIEVPVRGFAQQLGGLNVYLDREHLGGLLGYEPAVTGAMIRSSLGDEELKAALLAYDGAAVSSVIIPAYAEESIRKDYMGMMYIFTGIMILFAVAMAMAVIYNAVSIAFLERRREISTMLAMGCSVRRLGGMMTLENLTVGLASIIPGLAFGYLLSLYMMSIWRNEFFNMQAYLSPWSYVACIVGVILLVLLMQLPDFRKAGRMDVVAALRERTG